MASLRDQTEAYAYESRRQVAALLRGADSGRPLGSSTVLRDLVIGVAAGLLLMGIAVLIGYLGGRP